MSSCDHLEKELRQTAQPCRALDETRAQLLARVRLRAACRALTKVSACAASMSSNVD
jgi:hypothetical protein